jgi:acyl carrier protein
MSRLADVFRDVFELDHDAAVNGLQYRVLEQWDSVAHMQLVAAIEDEFDVMLDTDDVVDMSSFEKAGEILAKLGVDA